MKVWIGKTLVGIGLLHTAVGVAQAATVQRATVAQMAREGIVNTITMAADPARKAIFWYFVVGFALMLIGTLVNQAERLGQPLPKSTGWGFAALTLVGLVIAPISGLWLLIPPTVAMICRSPSSPPDSKHDDRT